MLLFMTSFLVTFFPFCILFYPCFSFMIDNEDPTILNTPSDITLEATSGDTVASWTEPTASDNSGSVSLTATHSPGSTFQIGSTLVTYTATDSSGNAVTSSFTVTVQGKATRSLIRYVNNLLDKTAFRPQPWSDLTSYTRFVSNLQFSNSTYLLSLLTADTGGPVCMNSPDDITVNTNSGEPTASVTWTQPTFADNSGAFTVTTNYEPGDTFPIGTMLVTYEAVDSSGNNGICSFTVTVIGILNIPLVFLSIYSNLLELVFYA